MSNNIEKAKELGGVHRLAAGLQEQQRNKLTVTEAETMRAHIATLQAENDRLHNVINTLHTELRNGL
ncbi:MAG: hypothetical protein H6998_00085 [Hahellaceae bacterium]|nr:hypothetical protein [Hahellaceae bacterium]